MQPIEKAWLRGKDLNLRPLGYELKEIRLSRTKQEREWHRKEVSGAGGNG